MGSLRQGLRALALRPGLAATVSLTITLVIGATVAVMSVIQGMLLRPLPFQHSEQLVAIEAKAGGETGKLASRELRDIRRDSTTIADLAAFYPSQYNVTGDGVPEALVTMIGTSNLFQVFGVRLLHGDTWAETLDWNTQFVVVLGHALWQRRYGGDPAIVGRSIRLDGADYTVAGVLPPGFDYPLKSDLYRAVTGYTAPEARRFTVVARLKPGISLTQAQAELDGFAATFAATYPETNRGMAFVARPLRDVFVGPARPYLLLLACGIVAMLIIACANLANLMLGRALDQRSEIAVRTALGAGRAQIVGLAMAEAMPLAVVGGVGGLLLGRWIVQIVDAVAAFELPVWITLEPDWITAVLASMLALTITSMVAVLPAMHVARKNVRDVIAEGSRRTVGSRRQQRVVQWLVGGQVAFAVVVLAAAALMGRTMSAVASVDPGFTARTALTFRVDPPWTRYGSTEAVSEFYRRAIERLSALPGALGAASNMTLPFGGLPDVTRTVIIEGQATAASLAEQPFVNFQVVSARYFDVMGIPLIAGRTFTEHDRLDTMPVAVVSARTASRFWREQDAVGKRIRTIWRTSGIGSAVEVPVSLTVIGVVGDVRSHTLAAAPALDLYTSQHQTFAGDTFLVVAMSPDAPSPEGSVAQAIRDVDPEQSIFDVKTMEQRMASTVWQQRTSAVVLAAIGGLSLVLAAVGVYGVLAYSVAQRRRELGLRRAVGANDVDVMGFVLRRGMTPVLLGAVAGMLAAVAAARAFEGLVFGVSPYDPISFVAATGVLIIVATCACWLPVLRALSVDPAEALRNT
jgi:putative ABC transport system permease protein